MRIACVASSRVPSTTANSIQVMKVCQSLVQVGGEVKLWVPGKTHTPWVDLAKLYGLSSSFEIDWLPDRPAYKRYDLAMASMGHIKKWKADLLYTWLPQAAWLGLIAGMAVILEVHDRPTGRLGPWLLRQTAASKGVKRLAIITRALFKVLQTEFRVQIRDENVVIAPNGVELERYTNLSSAPQARSLLNLPEMPTAVYSGHFYEGRGMELLFGLAGAFPQVQFLWVGGRQAAVDEWRAIIASKGLNNIFLTGFIHNSDLPLYQASGDFLLMPYERAIAGSSGGNSADICSPMKMFEYLACGRVILASDLPVFHEVLSPQNAVFCPPDNLEGWKTTLSDLLNNPQRGQSLAAQASLDAQAYSWRSRAEKTLQGFL